MKILIQTIILTILNLTISYSQEHICKNNICPIKFYFQNSDSVDLYFPDKSRLIPFEIVKQTQKELKLIFKSSNHDFNFLLEIDSISEDVQIDKVGFRNTLINGRKPIGAHFGDPYTMLVNFELTVKDVEFKVDANQYNDLYNLWFSESSKTLTKAFISEDSDYVYLYLFGGYAADTYLVKYIFKEGLLIRRFTINSFENIKLCEECF